MNNKITLQYYIGDKENHEMFPVDLYKKFNKTYKNYFVSEEIPFTLSNYKMNGVNLQFNISQPQFHPELATPQIRCYGLEKNINKVLDEMRKKFNIE